MTNKLEKIIPDWDGKTVGELFDILKEKGFDRQTSAELIDEFMNDGVEDTGTWLWNVTPAKDI